jgi:hypothetical protein
MLFVSDTEQPFQGTSPSSADPREERTHRRSPVVDWMPVLIALAIAALVRAGVLGSISW